MDCLVFVCDVRMVGHQNVTNPQVFKGNDRLSFQAFCVKGKCYLCRAVGFLSGKGRRGRHRFLSV